MTSIVLTEFTRKVNLRHFFVPREVVPRPITLTMADFDWRDNPVINRFRREVIENLEEEKFRRSRSATKNCADSMIYALDLAMACVLALAVLLGSPVSRSVSPLVRCSAWR